MGSEGVFSPPPPSTFWQGLRGPGPTMGSESWWLHLQPILLAPDSLSILPANAPLPSSSGLFGPPGTRGKQHLLLEASRDSLCTCPGLCTQNHPDSLPRAAPGQVGYLGLFFLKKEPYHQREFKFSGKSMAFRDRPGFKSKLCHVALEGCPMLGLGCLLWGMGTCEGEGS